MRSTLPVHSTRKRVPRHQGRASGGAVRGLDLLRHHAHVAGDEQHAHGAVADVVPGLHRVHRGHEVVREPDTDSEEEEEFSEIILGFG